MPHISLSKQAVQLERGHSETGEEGGSLLTPLAGKFGVDSSICCDPEVNLRSGGGGGRV